jgi:DNA-binding NarL/FixJ family response regulator
MPAPKRRSVGIMSTNPGEHLLSGEDWTRVATLAGLTLEEMKVTACLFQGMSRPQIAQKLGCAPGTAGAYVQRIFAKLKVRDRLGMALRVMELHLKTRDRATE